MKIKQKTALLIIFLILPLVLGDDLGAPATYFGKVTIDGVLTNGSIPVKFYLGDKYKVTAYVGNGYTPGLYFADFAKKISDPINFRATIYGIEAASGIFSQGVNELDLSINKVSMNGGCKENAACISGVCCSGVCKRDCFVPRLTDERDEQKNKQEMETQEEQVERPAAIDNPTVRLTVAEETGVDSKTESVYSDQSITGMAVDSTTTELSQETTQKTAAPVVASVSFALAALAVAAFLVFRKP